MRADLPSGTVTFLFTDVEGSTKLLHELGAEGYAEALAEHRRVIREACAREGGVEVDTQGDAFFFAFPTAPGALTAASAFTDALASGPIVVRVGLHTGTPLLSDEGYVGGDVHRAARIAAVGHGGQVLMSSSTAQLVELELTDLGEHRLKDLSASERIFQLGDSDFPALKSLYRTNLPVPATAFLGRQAELAEVVSLLGDARLLTLTGPGGTGKTRLAVQAAGMASGAYPDGVFWIPLAPLRDPALVLATAGQVLGARNGLAEHIADSRILCLFDNFEQVVEAAPELSTLLGACPNLTLLVTSRELLRVQGEVEYAVPPLAEPEAVSLFCERAQVDPSAQISELCARLDSLPLAVELAAARTKALSPAQILERLSGRLDLLRGGRDADPRQQTLRATIEWSYDLLSADEQQLFARLSVFSGGCTLEAAEEVADAELDILQSLVEKSLLRFSNERYLMLETIREFADERLDERSEADRVHEDHAAHFIRLAETSRRMLRGPEQRAWLELLTNEEDNLREALAGSIDKRRALFAFRLAHALEVFWIRANRGAEANGWLDRVLLLEPPDDPLVRARTLATGGVFGPSVEVRSARLAESIPVLREFGDEEALAFALRALAWMCEQRGDVTEARRALEEAVPLFERHGHSITTRLIDLGRIALELGDQDEARDWLERALVSADDESDALGALGAYEALGDIEFELGALDEAASWYRRGIEAAVGFDASHSLPFLLALSHVAFRRERFEEAGRLWGEAENIAAHADRAVWPHVVVRHDLTREALSPSARRSFEHGRLLASGPESTPID